MSELYNNNTVTTDTTKTNEPNANTKGKTKLYEDFCVFGNFFGLVPDRYEKYFNLFAFQITSTLTFAIIYYILLMDFDNHFFTQAGYSKHQFLDHIISVAIFMSINFQTTTAYVDIKCKSFLSRVIINLQIVSTFAITFLFLL